MKSEERSPRQPHPGYGPKTDLITISGRFPGLRLRHKELPAQVSYAMNQPRLGQTSFERGYAKMRIVVALSVLAVFVFTSLCLAADPWFIIKDANDVCKVIEAKEKTPKTIGGPYKTKDEAEKAKEKLCPKSAWFVIKDVNNVCKVIEAEDKTPKTIGGPYKTKDEAEKAKEKLCK